MGSQHTPGPWELSLLNNGLSREGGIAVDAPGRIEVAAVWGTKHDTDHDEAARANARLIAAAPDLLEALIEAQQNDEERRPYDDVEMCATDGDVIAKDELSRRDRMRTAIARATGKDA